MKKALPTPVVKSKHEPSNLRILEEEGKFYPQFYREREVDFYQIKGWEFFEIVIDEDRVEHVYKQYLWVFEEYSHTLVDGEDKPEYEYAEFDSLKESKEFLKLYTYECKIHTL